MGLESNCDNRGVADIPSESNLDDNGLGVDPERDWNGGLSNRAFPESRRPLNGRPSLFQASFSQGSKFRWEDVFEG